MRRAVVGLVVVSFLLVSCGGDDATWEQVSQGPLSPRTNAMIFATDDEVIVLGGQESESATDPLEDGAAYDVEAETWRELADPPVWGFTEGALVDGDVYVIGNKANADPEHLKPFFLRYDPETDAWEELPTPEPDAVWNLVMHDGALVAQVSNGPVVPDHRWDPDSDTWSEAPDIPADEVVEVTYSVPLPEDTPADLIARQGAASVSTGDRIFLFGGSSPDGLAKNDGWLSPPQD